jgi:hypothetical protein
MVSVTGDLMAQGPIPTDIEDTGLNINFFRFKELDSDPRYPP